mmetsp:Transcript_27554/g.26601  ORF Transcript_27554/g.26601 Transcript_27554/m.26601 type:complete len:118 (+) Transcript_27554:914-1267(+)|eukprot:CAMPEP_0170566964 /NCGR_PEP_ID=MMETSP0211-20121228/80177_1 /TAXON_ID=311385 /ORGANISM="Pseudokeronopsis sp., Strain OXSARD2" /LENGTH=117 /DNA_ID=CAMNT_0010888287 /DNA_START=1664 /DNA_END=2017 /DNA_ORIENTATION=+
MYEVGKSEEYYGESEEPRDTQMQAIGLNNDEKDLEDLQQLEDLEELEAQVMLAQEDKEYEGSQLYDYTEDILFKRGDSSSQRPSLQERFSLPNRSSEVSQDPRENRTQKKSNIIEYG